MKTLLLSVLLLPWLCVHAQSGSISYLPNKGQWQTPIIYQAKVPGGTAFLEKDKFTFYLIHPDDNHQIHDLRHGKLKEKDVSIRSHAFHINFINATTNPSITSQKASKEYYNYFIGKDASKWASNVRGYESVTYHDLYDGISMNVYSSSNNIEYDWIVKPSASTDQIKVNYEGIDKLSVLKNGNLSIQTSVGNLEETKPYSYQIIHGKQKEVSCKYKLDAGTNTVTFEFPNDYNHQYPLVIDPVLVFATFSGSTSDNFGCTATYDEAGDAYMGGVSFGFGYPLTIGAFQTTYDPGASGGGGMKTDMSISKFSDDGTQLLYSTYLGGNGNDAPHSLVVNDNNELIVLGTTGSTNYPTTTTAFSPNFNGGVPILVEGYLNYLNGCDIVVTKFNATGTALLGSTYVGGSQNDGLSSQGALNHNYADIFRGEVITDPQGNIYVSSTTQSTDFPIVNAFQTIPGGLQDAVVFKLSPDCSFMLWSSYLGGNLNEAGYGIDFDSNLDVFVCGGTESSNLATTIGTIHSTYQGGSLDGFLFKINNTGSSVLAATYIGTPSYDQTYFVRVDNFNNVYVYGQTNGTYPIQQAIGSSGIFSNPNSGQFIHSLNTNLTTTLFSTAIGTGRAGVIDIVPSAFMINRCKQIYLSGWGGTVGLDESTTIGLPITADAFDSNTDGSDFYIAQLDANCEQLLYATFMGGGQSAEHVDGGTSRFDKRGVVYQSVCAGCGGRSDFPTTPNAWSTTNNSFNCNNALFKFAVSPIIANIDTLMEPACAPGIIQFNNLSQGATSFFWDFGDGQTSTEEAPTHRYNTPNRYTITLIVSNPNSCQESDTIYSHIQVNAPPTATIDPIANFCLGDSVQLTAHGATTIRWIEGNGIANPNTNPATAMPNGSPYTVEVTDTNGCKDTLSINPPLYPPLVINLVDSIVIDFRQSQGLSVSVDGQGLTTYGWVPDPTISCTNCYFATVNPLEDQWYYFTASDDNGCTYIDSIKIQVKGAFYVPNSFTPNGDGKNDFFMPVGKKVQSMQMDIFDRWGGIVFSSNNITIGWNGKIKNEDAMLDVYTYKIAYVTLAQKKEIIAGKVMLLR